MKYQAGHDPISAGIDSGDPMEDLFAPRPRSRTTACD